MNRDINFGAKSSSAEFARGYEKEGHKLVEDKNHAEAADRFAQASVNSHLAASFDFDARGHEGKRREQRNHAARQAALAAQHYALAGKHTDSADNYLKIGMYADVAEQLGHAGENATDLEAKVKHFTDAVGYEENQKKRIEYRTKAAAARSKIANDGGDHSQHGYARERYTQLAQTDATNAKAHLEKAIVHGNAELAGLLDAAPGNMLHYEHAHQALGELHRELAKHVDKNDENMYHTNEARKHFKHGYGGLVSAADRLETAWGDRRRLGLFVASAPSAVNQHIISQYKGEYEKHAARGNAGGAYYYADKLASADRANAARHLQNAVTHGKTVLARVNKQPTDLRFTAATQRQAQTEHHKQLGNLYLKLAKHDAVNREAHLKKAWQHHTNGSHGLTRRVTNVAHHGVARAGMLLTTKKKTTVV